MRNQSFRYTVKQNVHYKYFSQIYHYSKWNEYYQYPIVISIFPDATILYIHILIIICTCMEFYIFMYLLLVCIAYQWKSLKINGKRKMLFIWYLHWIFKWSSSCIGAWASRHLNILYVSYIHMARHRYFGFEEEKIKIYYIKHISFWVTKFNGFIYVENTYPFFLLVLHRYSDINLKKFVIYMNHH